MSNCSLIQKNLLVRKKNNNTSFLQKNVHRFIKLPSQCYRSVNSFIMVIYENYLVVLWTENSSWTQKIILKDNYYKTLCKPVRSECSLSRWSTFERDTSRSRNRLRFRTVWTVPTIKPCRSGHAKDHWERNRLIGNENRLIRHWPWLNAADSL